MSKDLPEGLAYKEDVNLYRYCNGNFNFSTVSHDDEDYTYQKKKMMRDPMSHRIIEKRRRDRMNNCLADLSRLIPSDYLKKGRGRIEKTEIIEMAIKHMRHLQSVIASSRIKESHSDSSAGSSPESKAGRDSEISSAPSQQPIIMEHYRLGYLECLSEAMHFLVEVQGYFAGDSLCVQMINHLHRHCDKILKSNYLTYPRKHMGETTSNSSTSPTSGNYSNNSPPLGTSISNGSNSDDNRTNLPYSSDRAFEPIDHPGRMIQGDFRSPLRYSDLSMSSQSMEPKKNCESCYPRCSEQEMERMSENVSDSDPEQGHTGNSRTRICINGYEEPSKCSTSCIPGNCSSSSGIGSNGECPLTDDELVKEESGSSHLRDMLTAPKVISVNYSNAVNPIRSSEAKRSSSPVAQVYGGDAPTRPQHDPQSLYLDDHSQFQTDSIVQETHQSTVVDACHSESNNVDNHGNLYKFKNNIKQRFSKEKRNVDDEDESVIRKKPKLNQENPEGYYHCETQGKYLVSSLKHGTQFFARSDNCDTRRKSRYPSESEMQISPEVDSISNRLSFSHTSDSREKNQEDNSKLCRVKMSPFFSPDIPVDYKAVEDRNKSIGLVTITEYLPSEPGAVRKLNEAEMDRNIGVPIFALHAKGSFYVPLTLDQRLLTPFLSLLGLTKSEEMNEKVAVHPVTISVNFQSPYLSKNSDYSLWKYHG